MFDNRTAFSSPVGDPIYIFESAAKWADGVARELAAAARAAIEQRGLFTLALTGGGTPRPVYERMAAMDSADASSVDWNKARIFFGDERAVPPDHTDSNYGMARAAWLGKGAVPEMSVFRFKGEAKNLSGAAKDYETLLREQIPAMQAGEAEIDEGGAGDCPAFDIVLLGMGGDGHVASLFPGTAALAETKKLATANRVPQQGDAWRLTLTYPILNSARSVWMLVTGEGKAERVAQALGKLPGGETLPVSGVRPACGRRIWLLDGGAASRLSQV